MIAQIPLVVTDEDVVRVGARNPGWRVERIAGELVMTPPSGWKSDARAAEAAFILKLWAKRVGGIVTASQGGAKPENGDLMAPDAAWVSQQRWASLTAQQQEGFLPFAPDVVIEILSESDAISDATKKCERWRDGGVGYVVLIDPYQKTIATWGDAPADDFPDFAPILDM
jgi:Uma2 family endonuclease